MRHTRYSSHGPPNLFAQIIGLIVGIGLFVLAVIIGGFVLAALLGLGLLAWIAVTVRLWWLNRKQPEQAGDSERIVEAEYRVVEITDRDERRDP